MTDHLRKPKRGNTYRRRKPMRDGEGMATHEQSDLPPWEKMYNELEQRHVDLARKVIDAAAVLDAVVELFDGATIALLNGRDEAAAECRAMARRLRG